MAASSPAVVSTTAGFNPAVPLKRAIHFWQAVAAKQRKTAHGDRNVGLLNASLDAKTNP
jgi:hypothetical protein